MSEQAKTDIINPNAQQQALVLARGDVGKYARLYPLLRDAPYVYHDIAAVLPEGPERETEYKRVSGILQDEVNAILDVHTPPPSRN